jgi:Na+-transporting NADH:ubiquinone oxidoreductase subunit NqrF
MKATASTNMKIFLKEKYFSVKIDHWTSIANQNYAALTSHMVENFDLNS